MLKNTKNRRTMLGALLSGVFISSVSLISDYTPFAEFLGFFILYGAGIAYGLATANYLFVNKIKKSAWVLISIISYVVGVRVVLHEAGSLEYSFLYGGAAGALVLVVGYKLLERSGAVSWLLITVPLGSIAAYAVALFHQFIPFNSLLLLWPLWQTVVTWSLLQSSALQKV